jgi:prepilin-type N-terminal cleavage/methylation domain-containing protein
MNNKGPALNSGITLIELLLVIAMIGIITAYGLSSYNEFNKRQTVKGVAQNLKNDLRSAENKALTGEKNCLSTTNNGCGGSHDGCGNDTDNSEKALDYWEVSFAGGSYTMTGHCTGGAPPMSVSFGSTQVTMPTNINLTSTASPLQFLVLGQGVLSAANICVSGYGNRYKYKISVTASGEITDDGFVTNCP